jgi:hypothetical protein
MSLSAGRSIILKEHGECPTCCRLPGWGTRPHLPAHSAAAHVQYSTLPFDFLSEKVYMKELVSVLPVVDCLDGAPGHATPLTV